MNENRTIGVQTYKNNWYTYLITLLPVVMMYKAPILDIGFSTLASLSIACFLAILIIKRCKRIQWSVVGPIILYLIWSLFRSGGSMNDMLLETAVIIHILAISTGLLNLKAAVKSVVFITTAGSILVFIQTFLHYLLGIHIPMVDVNLCIDSMDAYSQALRTGFGGGSTLYRPSAFFLEPSHFAQYAVLAILFCLLWGKPRYRRAVFITLGVLLTTSGMGVVLVALIWCWHGFLVLRKTDLSKKITRAIAMVIIGGVTLLILLQIPVFQNTIARFMVPKESSTDGYNAIWGRTLFWDAYITPLSGTDLWFGKGVLSKPEVYFTGLMDMLYCYGIVGTALFYIALLWIAARKNTLSTAIALLFGGLMLIANLNGFISLLLFFGIMIASCPVTSGRAETDAI